jgi:uncharacterized protein YggU (UPF0235/DUF167 family)
MRLRVLAKPGQRADGLWRDGDGLVAHVRAAPKEGEANAYLERLLAERLGVAPSLVRVVKGQTSRHKTVEIDVAEAAAREAIERLCK